MINDAVIWQDMWIKNRIKNLPNSLPTTRSRRIALLVLIILVFLVYFGPSLYGGSHAKATTECLQAQLHQWESAFNIYDVSIKHDLNKKSEAAALPFVGNGNLGVVVGSTVSSDVLHIRYQHNVLSLAVPYVPIAQPQVLGLSTKEARVVHFREGQVYRIITQSQNRECISITQKVLAHRSRPSLLLQQITVENGASFAAKLSITVPGAYGWKDVATKESSDSSVPPFTLTSGIVKAPSTDKTEEYVLVSIATSSLPQAIEVQPKDSHTEWVLSVVHYSAPGPYSEMYMELHRKLDQQAKQEMIHLLSTYGRDLSPLADEHLSQWKQLWNSGSGQEIYTDVQISKPTPDIMNATMYYILSSVQSPVMSDEKSSEQSQQLQEYGCYSGPPTWLDEDYWQQVYTEQELADLVKLWIHTLFKNGCTSQLTAGAYGVMQAVLLSLLGIKQTETYLAINSDPRLFKHDLYLNNIIYNDNYLDLNILTNSKAIRVRVTPKKDMDENGKRKHTLLYACDAGCPNDPIPLGRKSQVFTLKYTEPQSSFLYIAEKPNHLVDLRKFLHIKTIKHVSLPQPPPHTTVRLPTIFWVTVVILIVSFHLFLFKLIFNEFCSGQDKFRDPRP
ncbi:uncharacterized protein KIAA2013 homolog [Saccoglossus kowalevskii]|uniref:Uncharacterized protein KIAA2013 homolog n=1 Tax=Saccoglossus kowalevskii TaxID=10224 RepID=A0ABM0GMH3_SACKO|nr:PREDICTED: uncharacterized protein KIAA2013 homolog [Saccoglossus kowalevskii]